VVGAKRRRHIPTKEDNMAEGTQKKNYTDGTAFKCLTAAVKRNEHQMKCCEMLLDALSQHPELDEPMCIAFGILPAPVPMK